MSDPYYTDPGFNPAAGTFTAPQTGRYAIKATVNYSTTAAITVSIGSANPSFSVRRITPAAGNLISGLFPLLNVSLTVLTLRAILGSGTVTLAGDAALNAGDVIGLFYEADGLTLGLNLGGDDAGGIVWSVHRIA